MSKQIIYYILLGTGIIVILTGLFIFFSNYGDTTVTGITSQVIGVILLFSGIVNIIAGVTVRKEGIKRRETVHPDSPFHH